jgi:xanthine dehydrogenase molybdopterin-binding subunit B
MQAGASARERLRVAAATKWGVPVEQVTAKQGVLTAGANSATYGELAADAVNVTLAEEPKIKAYKDWWLLGKEDVKRLDIPLKTNGTATYPIDVTVPGMVHAAVQSCPVPEGKLVSFDFEAIKGMPGVIAAVLIVFIPTVGDYVTPDLIGGGKLPMIANAIEVQMLKLNSKALGSALAVSAMLIVASVTVVFLLLNRRFLGGGR